MDKSRFFQIFVFGCIVWLGLWLWNDYVASFLTVVLGAILVAVLAVSLISEWIERSRVPRSYFVVLAVLIASSIFSALLYLALFEGKLTWLEK